MAGYSAFVGGTSIEFSERSNPAEQLGTHSGIGFGCLAELGSDGIAGCSTALLSCGEALLQPLKSTASASSISPRSFQLFIRMLLFLIECRNAAFAFLQGCQCGAPIALAHLGLVASQAGSSGGRIHLRA